MAEIVRDIELEKRMLRAVIADRNDHPRNKQVEVGPSSIGFCRELLRAQLFEGVNNALGMGEEIVGETHWAAAAHVGTVMGADLERIFGRRMGGLEQQRITTTFQRLGVQISGAMDLVFIDEDHVDDLKSTTDIGGLLYDLNKNAEIIESLLHIWREGKLFDQWVETPDGGYEHTAVLLRKFSKLQYFVQIAIYVAGAMQAGVLSPSATGRLVFYDRAGDFQEFVALVVSNEEIGMFYEIGQHRVEQVVQAQELLEEKGNPALIHNLRDQVPSFCFSPKVQCPMRERCWGGSDWQPTQILEGAELSSAVDRYIEGRRLSKIGDGMKSGARSELKDISGAFEDGRAVSWNGNRINVVETGAAEEASKAKSAVDVTLEAMQRVATDAPAARIESESGAVLNDVPHDVAGTLVLPDALFDSPGESVQVVAESLGIAIDENRPDRDYHVDAEGVLHSVPVSPDEKAERLRNLQRAVEADRAARHGA